MFWYFVLIVLCLKFLRYFEIWFCFLLSFCNFDRLKFFFECIVDFFLLVYDDCSVVLMFCCRRIWFNVFVFRLRFMENLFFFGDGNGIYLVLLLNFSCLVYLLVEGDFWKVGIEVMGVGEGRWFLFFWYDIGMYFCDIDCECCFMGEVCCLGSGM